MELMDASATSAKITTTYWIPILLTAYNLAANLSNDIYLPSLPKLVSLFSTSSGVVQLTMTAWFAGVALPQLFFGPLSDRLGRRPLLFGGGVCFIAATIVCMLAPNITTLIIGRFFQGIGVCSLNVTSFSTLSDLYEGQHKMRLTTYINICAAAAPLLGPIIGGYIFVWFGWRANFLLVLLLIIASLVGLWFKLPESNLELNPYALHVDHLYNNYFLLLRNKQLIKYLLTYCFLMGGLIAYLTGSSFIVIDLLKINPEHFGFSQFAIFGAYMATSVAMSFYKRQTVTPLLLLIGLILIAAGALALLVNSAVCGNKLASFVVPLMIFSAGFGLCGNLLATQTMSSFNENLKGYAAALLGCGMSIAATLGSLITGLVYNDTMISVTLVIFLMVLGAAITYFWFEYKAARVS
jgi:MFS transporter, DHA1 family, multidrug resistance protein